VEQQVTASQQAATRTSTQQNLETFIRPVSPLTKLSDSEMVQPENSVATTSAQPGTSGNNNCRDRSVLMPTRKMPKPSEENAPTFDTGKPEELGRFFERMEDWFVDEGIESDLDKKRRIVRYLDPDSEVQWKALSKFVNGTFEEFRIQVMASYPKAEEIMKGSVTALKKKITKIGPVAADD